MDETYVAVKGKWGYLYRAIDSDGQLVDAMLSEHRDMVAAKAFFESAKSVVGGKPKQVFTDGHTPYPRAIEETLGKRVGHRVIPCVGNPVEQDHQGIKQRFIIRRWGSKRSRPQRISAGQAKKCGITSGHERRWGK